MNESTMKLTLHTAVPTEQDICEICFHIHFFKSLSEEEQALFADDFISAIEARDVFMGGGHDATYFRGCLDLREGGLSQADGLELLKEIVRRHVGRVRELEVWWFEESAHCNI